jgi:hypothetical protein
VTDDKENPKPLDDLPTVAGDSSSEPEYKVGPGHPPKEYRWKKGCPSPHPKGRTPKDPVLSDLKKIFEEAINKKYKVKKGDKDVFLTRMALGIDQVLNKFAKGDRHAWSMLTEMADKLDVDFLAGQKGKIQEAVQPSHQAILDAYVARQLRGPNQREWSPVDEDANAPNELREGLVSLRPPKTTRKVNRVKLQ